MDTQTRQLMTMGEVAEHTRIPVNTLRFYRHKGVGPASALIGGRVMYLRETVDAWIAEQFENAGASK